MRAKIPQAPRRTLRPGRKPLEQVNNGSGGAMNRVHKAAPFVILSTGHGSMIVNRNDYFLTDPEKGMGFGVGMQLFSTSLFDAQEVDMALEILKLRKIHHGDGVIGLDCGANIGVHAIEWARLMTGWGSVVAFEPQERIYYALAGNIAINNLFNARCLHAAVGGESGLLRMPVLDYTLPASYGSFELKPAANNQFIGQHIDYENGQQMEVNVVSIDDLECERVDFIKLDVEGMELEALQGAARTIETFKPIMLVEHIKAEPGSLQAFLEPRGYRCIMTPLNIVAVHKDDPCSPHIEAQD
jgi:FkbM family methyltransferase